MRPVSDGRPSWARRLIRFGIFFVVPVVTTGLAALLGYAFALYPIWHHVEKIRMTETIGGIIAAPKDRGPFIAAYPPDSGVAATTFDDIAWAVRTVMTPFVGYAAAPGQRNNAHIDAHQFRGSRPLAMPKEPGVTRVFLTGASVAFSAGASSDARTIGGYLQKLLDDSAEAARTRFEVFTFATPAWSSTHERIAIENRISELEPDLVVQLTGMGDALYGERGNNVLWSRALTDQYYWDLVNIALQRSGFEPMIDVEETASSPVAPELVAARLQKNVRLAAAALAFAHARLHVFLQPSIVTSQKALSPREQSLRDAKVGYFKDHDYYKACYRRIDELFGDSPPAPNAAYTNLAGIFDAVPATDEVFLDGAHFGDRGNLRIAQAIVDAIR